MDSEYTYEFTQKALNDLDKIIGYIAEDLLNSTAAKAFYEKVFKKIGVLCSFPEAGRFVDNKLITDKTVRRFLIDDYILYYKVEIENKVIQIIDIVYGKINLERIYRNI